CSEGIQPMYEQIPVEVLQRYEGQWIVWDQDDRKVIGSGETLDEAEDQAQHASSGHLLRIHHVLFRDVEITGML
ncbi:MAG: DUF5678 domain-containing protein, partial [Planctomycetaceae bacterium]